MTATSTQGRSSDPRQLVESFQSSSDRYAIYVALQAHPEDVLPAVREGLRHENRHVRHWCAIFLDRNGDEESLNSLLPLLNDPDARVRLWAVHTIACEHCKDYGCPVDPIPLLIEHAQVDPSARVRKMAIAMLANLPADTRAVPVLKETLQKEDNAKIRLHTERAIQKYREAGIAISTQDC